MRGTRPCGPADGPIEDTLLCITAEDGSYPTKPNRTVFCRVLSAEDLAAFDTGEWKGFDPSMLLFRPTEETLYALHVGASMPPPGTIVIVHRIRGRWVFTR